MSAFENKKKKELILAAMRENLDKVQAFLEKELRARDCPDMTRLEFSLAVEEVFLNIATYAYGGEKGTAAICIEDSDDTDVVTVVFKDRGIAFNPLLRHDPDVNIPIEKRKVGGMGIFLTKKMMDEVSYEYRDGQNVLTMRKRLLR